MNTTPTGYCLECGEGFFSKEHVKNQLFCKEKCRTTNYNGNFKHGKTIELLGATAEEVKKHIESLFVEGMSWDNYSWDTWHIDHIIPLAAFDLRSEQQQKFAFHYTNLQPLWFKENIAKGDKF